jgi:hypothetical protein
MALHLYEYIKTIGSRAFHSFSARIQETIQHFTADEAALNGLSSILDGQSIHFPQDSRM